MNANEIREVTVDDKVYPLSITAEHKDKVLNALITKAAGKGVAVLEYSEIADEIGISQQLYETIIAEFKSKELISSQGFGTRYTLMHKIYDYYNHGGFVGEETILLANLDKLILEVERLREQLSPDLLSKIEPNLKAVIALAGLVKMFLSE
jgi:hypothetical protein